MRCSYGAGVRSRVFILAALTLVVAACGGDDAAQRCGADILDVDLARDHVVTQTCHDLREQLEPVALLVRDQNAEMLRLALDHSKVFSVLQRALQRSRHPRTQNVLRNTSNLFPASA